MKYLGALTLALVLSTGAALAQGAGGGSGGSVGGAETGKGGTSTGREASIKPTADQCAKGWDSFMRMTQAEFNAGCKK
jgi:hypothetical protein